MSLPHVEKDAFITETMVTLARFGDFLLTVESSLENLKVQHAKRSPCCRFGWPLSSRNAARLFKAHRKRYDRDMSRVFRYSAVTSLYTILEMTARRFIHDFAQSYPDRRPFKSVVEKHSSHGFVRNFREWLELRPASVVLRRPEFAATDDLRIIRNCHNARERRFEA